MNPLNTAISPLLKHQTESCDILPKNPKHGLNGNIFKKNRHCTKWPGHPLNRC